MSDTEKYTENESCERWYETPDAFYVFKDTGPRPNRQCNYLTIDNAGQRRWIPCASGAEFRDVEPYVLKSEITLKVGWKDGLRMERNAMHQKEKDLAEIARHLKKKTFLDYILFWK